MASKRQVQFAQAEAPRFRRVTWYRDSGLIRLYLCCAVTCLASATTGYDGSMLNSLQNLDSWRDYFNDPSGSLLGLYGSIFSIGSLCGLPFAPYIADRWGRKPTIWAGCMVLFLGVAVQAASIDFRMFIIARFFVGFGCTLAQLASPLLLTEIAHPQHRGRVTAVYNCLWNFGAIIATWLTFGTGHIPNHWAWRIPSIIQAFPSLFQAIFLLWVPESPRWLIAQDRAHEALHILAKYHANGDQLDPTVMFEYAEIKETIRLEYLIKKQTSFLDFLKTRGNRYRLCLILSLGLFSQWSGGGLVAYYFRQIMLSIGQKNENTIFEINGSLNILSLLVSVGCAFLVDKVGRRPLFLISTSCMLVIYVIWTLCTALYQTDDNEVAGKTVIAMIFLYSISYAVAWSGLLVAYTVEILPFKLRAKGLMLMNLFVQVALVFNQYVNPVGLKQFRPQTWKFLLIYCCILAVELAIIAWFYVETKGPTLEEIAKIFDGDRAETGIANLHDVKADMRVQDVMDKFGTFTRVESVPMEDRSGRRRDLERLDSGGSERSWAYGEKPKARIERVPTTPRRTGSGNETLLPQSPTMVERWDVVRNPRRGPTGRDEDSF
ncbi:uncharacterized protein LTR77_000538 [Saxophila tyrrhenica]|uniref:Major facilitator superfamily (MFS) profile domain-containing protein n=1 Tax=Saxophila tyrrhenica TaxID=1690608 RepID=A0AAV9PMY9_9PEZI|nr:hypothetical protein LTR77_000538 [Saxophila tyrrhenica]